MMTQRVLEGRNGVVTSVKNIADKQVINREFIFLGNQQIQKEQ